MKVYHLDSSILIPYYNVRLGRKPRNKEASEKNEKARAFMEKSTAGALRMSLATYAEVVREFHDVDNLEDMLAPLKAPLAFRTQEARRWARLQNRSSRVMGDNDAWNAALAICENATLVGSDHAFENRPDLDYVDFMRV